MAYRSLRDFIERLEAEGELVRVTEPVSTVLEMTEICRRHIASGGPAVLFEKPGRNTGQIVGRTPHLQPVHVDAPAALIGSIRLVQIEALMGNSLRGRLI